MYGPLSDEQHAMVTKVCKTALKDQDNLLVKSNVGLEKTLGIEGFEIFMSVGTKKIFCVCPIEFVSSQYV